MKNKEKFAKEIIEIACDCCILGVNKNTGKPKKCSVLDCDKCLFSRSKIRCDSRKKLREWAESEYIEKPVISKRDRAFLEYLVDDYIYIARDNDTSLCAYNAKPSKSCILWKPKLGEKYLSFGCFIIDFPMVKWSDSEPWLIEDLKKLEVVEDYE